MEWGPGQRDRHGLPHAEVCGRLKGPVDRWSTQWWEAMTGGGPASEGPQHCGLRTQAEVSRPPGVPQPDLTTVARIGQAIVGGTLLLGVLWRSLSRFTVLSDFGFPTVLHTPAGRGLCVFF